MDDTTGRKVFIAGPKNIEPNEYCTIFTKFGTITDAEAFVNYGRGIITFSEKSEAENAVAEMNGYLLPGTQKPLKVKIWEEPEGGPAEKKVKLPKSIYITVPSDCSSDTIKQDFHKFGEITWIEWKRDQTTDDGKTTAMVKFLRASQAQYALEYCDSSYGAHFAKSQQRILRQEQKKKKEMKRIAFVRESPLSKSDYEQGGQEQYGYGQKKPGYGGQPQRQKNMVNRSAGQGAELFGMEGLDLNQEGVDASLYSGLPMNFGASKAHGKDEVYSQPTNQYTNNKNNTYSMNQKQYGGQTRPQYNTSSVQNSATTATTCEEGQEEEDDDETYNSSRAFGIGQLLQQVSSSDFVHEEPPNSQACETAATTTESQYENTGNEQENNYAYESSEQQEYEYGGDEAEEEYYEPAHQQKSFGGRKFQTERTNTRFGGGNFETQRNNNRNFGNTKFQREGANTKFGGGNFETQKNNMNRLRENQNTNKTKWEFGKGRSQNVGGDQFGGNQSGSNVFGGNKRGNLQQGTGLSAFGGKQAFGTQKAHGMKGRDFFTQARALANESKETSSQVDDQPSWEEEAKRRQKAKQAMTVFGEAMKEMSEKKDEILVEARMPDFATEEETVGLFDCVPAMISCTLNLKTHIAKVLYESQQCADYAVKRLNNFDYMGTKLEVRVGPISTVSVLSDTAAKLKESLGSLKDGNVGKDALSAIMGSLKQITGRIAVQGTLECTDIKAWCNVKLPKVKPKVSPSAEVKERLFVTTSPRHHSHHLLEDVFCRFGNLIKLWFVEGKSYGFAHFADKRSANACMKTLENATVAGDIVLHLTEDKNMEMAHIPTMHGAVMDGRKIKAELGSRQDDAADSYFNGGDNRHSFLGAGRMNNARVHDEGYGWDTREDQAGTNIAAGGWHGGAAADMGGYSNVYDQKRLRMW